MADAACMIRGAGEASFLPQERLDLANAQTLRVARAQPD